MSVVSGPRIITSNLVFELDAANTKSYPGSGTTWTDLVVGGVGTLTGGPTYSSSNGGSIVCNGSAQWISVAYNANFDFSGDFSVCLWVYHAGYNLTYQTLIDT